MAARKSLPVTTGARSTTIGFVNLGCAKNQVDAEVMLGSLTAEGYALTADAAQADVIVINTCGFVEEAKQESINAIIEYGSFKKTGRCKVLVAAGCLAQRYQGELLEELPELDAVVGTGEIGRIAEICRTTLAAERPSQQLWMAPPPYLYDGLTPRLRLGPPHTAYVKIAEGCNRNCAFCAIPLMRGKQRSRTVASIVEEVRRLAAEGVKEINLISQDTINYGVDLGLKRGLTALLKALVDIPGLRWIRPFYLYPQPIDEELIELYAGSERIAKYLDMPLQHINDEVLGRMHRLGTKASITDLIEGLRRRIPGLTVRTGFIVGYPGETNAQFAELKRYLTDMEFDRVGVFLYSDEEGTPAVELTRKLDRQRIEARRTELMALQESIALKKSRLMVGRTLEVLVDGPSEESPLLLAGRHEGQAPDIDGVVYLSDGPADRPPLAGDLVKVTITEAAAYDLVGCIVG
ncbi:MAG: 30S ribosomal protein S12 methylthiotransferase RimO [Nitrospira sp.]|nr:30S ribosomal protein S12 methylthiotransferase RimO [Nitrospira sp.]